MRRFSLVSCLVVAIASLTSVATGPPAAAAPRPDINPAQAFDAPIGERGGILSPAVFCEDWDSKVRVRWTVTNVETGDQQSYRWRTAAPGMEFPRLPVGDYRSRTVATCDGARASDVDQVSIRQKTRRSTLSRPEFRRIERGMTPSQVRRLVGNPGRDPFRWDGKRTLTYDNMAFWRWSLVTYRDGRVVEKYWDVGHD